MADAVTEENLDASVAFAKEFAKKSGSVIAITGAILFPMDDITDFLYLIGSVFAPMIAIQIADFFILHRDKRDDSFDGRNLAIWMVGFILYRALMHIDLPVGNTLPDMAVTSALCVIVGKRWRVQN